MKKIQQKLSCLLALVILLSMTTGPVFAASRADKEVKETARFLYTTVDAPEFGTMAGEWTVLSLARSGEAVPAGYYDNYYKKVEEVVKSKNGDLSKNKFTEYSRVICSLTSIGKDPRNVAGYDLVKPLSNFKHVLKQGLNGPIWALIALDAKGYELSKIDSSADQNSRERMVEEILRREVNGGGWNLMGEKADPDMTAMALYSLVPYRNQPKVKAAIDRGVQALSDMQLPTGGYQTMGAENSESSAQTIIALTSLGIDPSKDHRFVKSDANGRKQSVVDALLTYKAPQGGFKHVQTETSANGMGTDQAMEALVALKRFEEKKPALFDMKQDGGLKGNTGVVSGNQGFTDIQGHWAEALIQKTKGYGIANGSKAFTPNKDITRGEFAVGLVRGLNLKSEKESPSSFKDVRGSEWYGKAISIATAQGIIKGRGDGNFDPNANITRQEAMSMLARALPQAKGNEESLKQFKDINQIADWAKPSAALMVEKGIVKGRPEGLAPLSNINRAEGVQMINRLAGVK